MGLGIQGVSWITDIGIGISMRPKFNLYAHVIALVTTFLLAYILMPYLGILGLGLGVLTGHIFKTFLVSFFAQKIQPMSWNFKPVIFLITWTNFVGLFATISGNSFEQYIDFILLVTTLFVGWFGLFSKQERVHLMIQLKEYKSKYL